MSEDEIRAAARLINEAGGVGLNALIRKWLEARDGYVSEYNTAISVTGISGEGVAFSFYEATTEWDSPVLEEKQDIMPLAVLLAPEQELAAAEAERRERWATEAAALRAARHAEQEARDRAEYERLQRKYAQ